MLPKPILSIPLHTKPHVERWVVGLSGGVDSMTLLSLVVAANAALPTPKPVVALHVNHQLSDDALAWQHHCQQQAHKLGVDFVSETVVVTPQGQGVEAAARYARYHVFEGYLQQGDCLLLGHHRDDQMETVLLRLLRGAGVLGLGAIPPQRSVGQGFLWRPLLDIPRSMLCDYAQSMGLVWVEDESNASMAYDRNYIRHHIAPALASRWPQGSKKIADAAIQLREAQSLLDELASLDMASLDERPERYGYSIDRRALLLLSRERCHNLLRFWCGWRLSSRPDHNVLEQINEQLLSTDNNSSTAVVKWGACESRRFQQRLYVMPALPPFVPPAPDTGIPLGMTTHLHCQLLSPDELNADDDKHRRQPLLNMALFPDTVLQVLRQQASSVQQSALIVRWRQGGERCCPEGRSASQTLKKLLQEYGLETWLRDRVPLLYYHHQLVAVGDLWVCEGFGCTDRAAAGQLVWSLAGSTAIP